jgi:hypothetical protein
MNKVSGILTPIDRARPRSGSAMKRLMLFFACLPPAVAAITGVSVQGTTATQAILRFTAPDNGACTAEVSESASFAPLVHDVDASLFPGSNLDNRTESVSSGRERVFVIGKRRAEKAVNGKWYSRALQAFTPHYYRITCGADQSAGSFSTANIALGNTYNEPLPPDPGVVGSTLFVNAGRYAWPEFTGWDIKDPTARQESIIDPQTGLLLKRITMPRDQDTQNSPAGDHVFTSTVNPTGGWTGSNNILVDDANSATYSGTGQDWLVLTDNAINWLSNNATLETLTFSVKAWCTGACVGDNARLQACLTVNGVSCWPANASAVYIDMQLGTTPNAGTFVVAGTPTPLMADWTPPGYQPLNNSDLAQQTNVAGRQGHVNVDTSGNVTYVDGSAFYPGWTAGSLIAIAGSVCSIAAVANPKSISIAGGSCSPALTLPQSAAAYRAGNFGVMIRKKTASTDTITVQFAKYYLTSSGVPGWTASGSPQICSDQLTQGPGGHLGYHCQIPTGNMVYWIDRATGDANYLGLLYSGSAAGNDGWQNQGCNTASTNLVGHGQTNPESFYCGNSDNLGNPILLGCTLTSTNAPGNLVVSCSNLTSASTGHSIQTLVTNFTAGQSTVYDPAVFSGCGFSIQQGVYLIGTCLRGNQDTYGWVVVFDPTLTSSAAGCVGGGKPGCIIAAKPSWTTAGPQAWCTIHNLNYAGNSATAYIGDKFLGDQLGTAGGGWMESTITSPPITSTPTIAPGVNGCPPGSRGCDLVTVDGEPCNPNPAPANGGHSAEPLNCPKNAAWNYLQDAVVGDILWINEHVETVKLIAKPGGNQWLIQRGYSIYQPPVTPTPPIFLQEICQSIDFQVGASSWQTVWDFAADPHGLSASNTVRIGFDYDHATTRPNMVVGGSPSYEPTFNQGYSILDGQGYGRPNKTVSSDPPFAGVKGVTQYNEQAQDHPSYPVDTTPSPQYFFDARPLTGPDNLNYQAFNVSGQLYKYATTTSDGDNLTNLGGLTVTGGFNSGIGTVARKKQPTMAFCGAQPLVDMSSAALGNVIGTGTADAYKYCIARKAGECRAASSQGDMYMNCPWAQPGINDHRDTSYYGCGSTARVPNNEGGLANDLCFNDAGSFLNGVIQYGYVSAFDLAGAQSRMLTKGLIRYRNNDVNMNVRTLPDGSWLLFASVALAGSNNEILAGKMPPYPAMDSVSRGTFVPMVLSLVPPNDIPVDNALVQFGYAENGAAGQFYCTSRHEACLAVAAAVPADPFKFPSDGADGTAAGITGVRCVSGCSVAIPGIPQRLVYYQVQYRDSGNRVIAQTELQVAVIP